MAKIQARARVQLLVEVSGLGVWDDAYTIARVHSDAEEAAQKHIEKLNERLRKEQVRIIRVVKVEAVLVDPETGVPS